MIFHQISERKLVKFVFSPGKCCKFRDFDNRKCLLFFRLSKIVSKMLAKTSFRKVRKSLVNTVSIMTWDFSGGPEGRSMATFLGTEIVQRAPRTRPFEPQNGIWALGAFFDSREATLKDPLSPKSCKIGTQRGPKSTKYKTTYRWRLLARAGEPTWLQTLTASRNGCRRDARSV